MDRFAPLLERLKTFGASRPVAYGAPTCAIIGALAGLAMRTGPQDGPHQPDMEPVAVAYETVAEPISWPSGKVPDYVVGTDFLKMTQAPQVEYASYEPAYEPPPPPEIPPYVPGEHGPATSPPDPDSARWPSARGDILDVSLPEDSPPQPAPTLLADAAATGMTTR